MDSKAVFKLGTFIRNFVTTNPKFQSKAYTLGVDLQTDPVYVLQYLEKELPHEELEEIIQVARKSPVRDFVDTYFNKK